ncbi:MAG: hypothetical protein JWQ87_3894 [Candidatus Sulfotelmatobacter sp.]|nr:hypothetical protein [Candidatus Sulfotelmatobacter sp.]
MFSLVGSEGSVLYKVAATAQQDVPEIVDQAANADIELWEHHLETEVEQNSQLPETDRQALIVARRGQGLFKDRVMQIERRCRITHVENAAHLRASHCKPWRDCNNDERLNGENGLLLTPSIDHLFDRGFIGFENSGNLIISPVAHTPSLQRMGIDTNKVVNVGGFTHGQREFLEVGIRLTQVSPIYSMRTWLRNTRAV